MSDMIGAGVSWLAGQLKANASVTVTYRRPSTGQSVQLQATLGRSLLRVRSDEGSTYNVRTDRDFIVSVADLVLGGVAVTPNDGDQVDLTIASATRTYEAMPVGSDPAWRYSDNRQVMYRIHTKYRSG